MLTTTVCLGWGFTCSSVSCSINCLHTLANIVQHNAVFKDVYREVGLLEVLVTCLHRYATVLKEAFPDGEAEPIGRNGRELRCRKRDFERRVDCLVPLPHIECCPEVATTFFAGDGSPRRRMSRSRQLVVEMQAKKASG